jgi:hypothetical protein
MNSSEARSAVRAIKRFATFVHAISRTSTTRERERPIRDRQSGESGNEREEQALGEQLSLGAQSYSILDGRVLAFTLIVSVITALVFGVLPSLYAGRIQALHRRISSRTRGSRLLRESLSCAQVMLTMILLAGSVSLGRAFVHLMRIRPRLRCERSRD